MVITKAKHRLQGVTRTSKKALTAVLVGITVVITAASSVTIVAAQSLQQQISDLSNQNAQSESALSDLTDQANSYQDLINKLQTEVNALQQQINEKQAQVNDLQKQIEQAEAELAQQKDLLGKDIRAMYVEGDISTIEMLASSKDLSEFVDKQQYRNSVKNKIIDTLNKINDLKHQLKGQKEEVEKVLTDQKAMQSRLNGQKSEQNRLLGLNQSQQGALNDQIKNNSAKIAELQRQQAIENAKHAGPGQIVSSGSCGGGYPAVAVGPYGNWGCNYAKDNTIDNWGMYNRECVSYTAYRVAASGRYMPYWGGRGNANRWDDNARAAGIPVDGNPRPGDIAIAHWGYYGHAMYVESVNSNGTINVSQYNWSYDGTYSMMYNFSTSGLVFIHF